MGQAVQEGGLVLDVRAQEPLVAVYCLQAVAGEAADDKVLEERRRRSRRLLGLGRLRLILFR